MPTALASTGPRATVKGLQIKRRRATWCVYMLRCRDGSLYTGVTNDLGRRLEQHGAGTGARYTRSRLPVMLVHQERARNRGQALRREAALKRLTRVEKLALLAAGQRATPRRNALVVETLRVRVADERARSIEYRRA